MNQQKRHYGYFFYLVMLCHPFLYGLYLCMCKYLILRFIFFDHHLSSHHRRYPRYSTKHRATRPAVRQPSTHRPTRGPPRRLRHIGISAQPCCAVIEVAILEVVKNCPTLARAQRSRKCLSCYKLFKTMVHFATLFVKKFHMKQMGM